MLYFVGEQDLFQDYASATLSDVMSYLDGRTVTGLDIETTRRYSPNKYVSKVYEPGLDPHLTRICMIQIGDANDVFVIDARQFKVEQLQPLFQRKHKWIIHFAKFEYSHIKYSLGVELDEVHCTYLVERNLYNGETMQFSLKSLAERYLGATTAKKKDLFSEELPVFLTDDDGEEAPIVIDKDTRSQFQNIGDRKFSNTQIEYGALDVTLAYKIYELQIQGRYTKTGIYNPQNLHRLENRVMKTFANMELAGIPFSKEVWLAIYNDVSYPLFKKEVEWLNDYVVQNHKKFCKLTFFGDECAIKWTSPKQVIAFFKSLGFCPLEYSKSKKRQEYSASAKALAKIRADVDTQYHELIDHYLKFKEAEQACTLFGPDFLKYIHPVTGRIHPSYNQIVNTGRPSCANPNLLNIPSGAHRTAFTAPEGYKYIGCDFDAQELRVISELSQNEVMMEIFKGDDPDMHSITAQAAYRKALDRPDLIVSKALAEVDSFIKELREAGKKLNFRILYGASAFSFKHEINASEEETQLMIDGFYEAYPGLRQHFDRLFQRAIQTGYVVTDRKLDRRRFMPYHKQYLALKEKQRPTREEKSLIRQYEGQLMRYCQNNEIQGTSAGVTKLAQILFEDRTRGMDVQLIVAMYDELGAIAHESIADEVFDITRQCMLEAGEYFLKDIKLTSSGKITGHWKH
jgi:DNA polymerase I-like protein with 3'-5' exonuclease and polymerase domains